MFNLMISFVTFSIAFSVELQYEWQQHPNPRGNLCHLCMQTETQTQTTQRATVKGHGQGHALCSRSAPM